MEQEIVITESVVKLFFPDKDKTSIQIPVSELLRILKEYCGVGTVTFVTNT